MNRIKVFNAIAGIDESLIDGAAASAAPKGSSLVRRMALAACLLLAVAFAGAAVLTVAAESAEYNRAEAFFDENGLSSDGLTRSEIKEVYRDITSKRFVMDKTAEVIAQSVPGFEIERIEPTPEELSVIWDTRRLSAGGIKDLTGFGMEYRCSYSKTAEENDDSGSWFLECYSDGILIWTSEFEGLYIDGWKKTRSGTAAWGWDASDVSRPWIARLDENGKIIWTFRPDHGNGKTTVNTVIDNGDGTWSVFDVEALRFLYICRVDAAGNEIGFTRTEVGDVRVDNAVRLGDDYIVQLRQKWQWTRQSRLMKIDASGTAAESFVLDGEDCTYYVTDMTESGGRFYLSAYAAPKQSDEGGRDEIAGILDFIWEKKFKADSAELTPLVRKNYTAVLLLADPDSGVPTSFYSVDGALGAELTAVDGGGLEWKVRNVTSASPASGFSSSASVYLSCRIYSCVFAPDGTLTGMTDTGENVIIGR